MDCKTAGRLFRCLGIVCLAACADRSSMSSEALGRAVRSAGYPCESVVEVSAIDSAETNWRVACANAETYMAYVQAEGHVCVEPLILGDAAGPAPLNGPEPLCER